jgi:hypothetical protein
VTSGSSLARRLRFSTFRKVLAVLCDTVNTPTDRGQPGARCVGATRPSSRQQPDWQRDALRGGTGDGGAGGSDETMGLSEGVVASARPSRLSRFFSAQTGVEENRGK